METQSAPKPPCPHCGAAHDAALKFCPMTGKAIETNGNGTGPKPVIAAPAPAGLPTVGAEVDRKYRLQRLVGMGAIGQLFEAEHLLAGRRVAMRFLHPRLRGGDFERRFLGEVRAVGTVGHENIAELLDVGASTDFGPYVVMELVDGETLAAALTQHGVIELERAIDILAQVLSALEAAHAKNVICRDLRPENVMLATRAGRTDFVKLLDFGLTKEGAGAQAQTPYVAPEQISGGTVDGRADVYSAGVMFYQALTGQVPQATQGRAPAAPSSLRPELPAALDGVVLHAIASAPGGRWQTARELRDALRAFSSRRLTRPSGYPTMSEQDAAALRPTIAQAIPASEVHAAVAEAQARQAHQAQQAQPIMAEPVAPQKGKSSKLPKSKSKPPTGSHLVHDPHDTAEHEFFSNEAMPALHTDEFDRPATRKGPIIAVASLAGIVIFGGLAYMIAGRSNTGPKVEQKIETAETAAPPRVAPPSPAPVTTPATAPAAAGGAAPTETPTSAPTPTPPAQAAVPSPPPAAPTPAPAAPTPPAPTPAPVVKETPPPAAPAPKPIAKEPPPLPKTAVKESPKEPAPLPKTAVKEPPAVKKPAPKVEAKVTPPPAPKAAPKPKAASAPKAAPAAPTAAKKKPKREIITDNPY